MLVFNIGFETTSYMEPKINARLFALVIGIEKYAFKRFNDLLGVTPGVNEIVN